MAYTSSNNSCEKKTYQKVYSGMPSCFPYPCLDIGNGCVEKSETFVLNFATQLSSYVYAIGAIPRVVSTIAYDPNTMNLTRITAVVSRSRNTFNELVPAHLFIRRNDTAQIIAEVVFTEADLHAIEIKSFANLPLTTQTTLDILLYTGNSLETEPVEQTDVHLHSLIFYV